ncbi:fungal-specific transcription factor domain-containing protein [Aspergillus novoparasiticus]|uniref:Fungal-specific transcription factor domain-containing protein n=1 Tax=Aspergillus novoparasiticus TaxID=986946 RepID=A0A5N6EL47_9EURO|nr:fungal-specific transcription factor domain-containing protein [Aspergillus novoparasiticus]
MSTSPPPAAKPQFPALRPRKGRTKTGCVYCRLRRKKCDERKPQCSSCTRLSLICTWPDPSEFAWRKRLGEQQCSQRTAPERTIDQQASPSSPSSVASSRGSLEQSEGSSLIPSISTLPSLFPESESMSVGLLQLYVEQTTGFILSVPEDFRDPFIYDVIPLAFEDTLVRNAVYCLGGIPLPQQNQNHPLEIRRLHHYAYAVKQLKDALTEWNNGSNKGALRLLLTTTLLCQYEVLRGNQNGVLAYHLRASSFLAQHIVGTDEFAQNHALSQVLVEMYAYLELSSALHLSATPNDPQLGPQSAISSIAYLRRFTTFGTLFGSASALYEMIPDIRRLADLRQKELVQGVPLGCNATFNAIMSQLQAFDWNSALATGPSSSQEDFLRGKAAAGRLVQNAMLLFLFSAYRVHQRTLKSIAHVLVDTAIEMGDSIIGTTWRNPTFWPAVVIGSYASTNDQRARIMEYLRPSMALTSRARELLMRLWSSPDEAFGLDGLAKIIAAEKASYCFG